MKTTGQNALSRQDALLLAVDLTGTFVFAVEGALDAIRSELDLFGLLVLAFATALGGGILRDVLIGCIPPNSIRDWRYGTTAFVGGGAVFCFYQLFQQVPNNLILTLDAAGLALFAVAGADKALEYGIHPLLAVLMGAITGTGGGSIRDMFLNRVPAVLHAGIGIYASAAVAGAAVMIFALRLKMPRRVAMSLGGLACFALRMVGLWQHWDLPRVMTHAAG